MNYKQTLQDSVTFVANAWHNFVYECDVHRDGNVTAFDALLLINYLGRSSGNSGLPSLANTMPWYYDVPANDRITSPDALRVINCLDSPSLGNGESEATPSAVNQVAVNAPLPTLSQMPVRIAAVASFQTDAVRETSV